MSHKHDRLPLIGIGLLFLVVVVMAILAPCLRGNQQPKYIEFKDDQGQAHRLKLELAVTAEQQRQGLMHRTELAADEGMLFIFDHPKQATFWMQNTLVSLDIIFLDSQTNVVEIHKQTKVNQTTELYGTNQLAAYGLEVKAGWAEQVGLQKGDHLNLLNN